jgi:CRISPR-associated protein Cst2
MDFGNNMGIARRNPANEGNDLFQSEIHKSFYSYTATIDLDRVGIDENYDIKLSSKEKNRRIHLFLDAVKLLYRDIRGKRENLAPVFVIGGVYDSGNPFFYNKIKLDFSKNGVSIQHTILNDQLITEVKGNAIKEATSAGEASGMFLNTAELDLDVLPVEKFFTELKAQTTTYYGA